MDPLGFALEQFDAVGKWRTADAGTPVDPSGTLPDGSTFRGLDGLRTLLDGRREEFVSTVTEKLLAYALGRGLEHYDMPAVRKIVRDAARRRPPLVVDHSRNRQQRAISHARQGIG